MGTQADTEDDVAVLDEDAPADQPAAEAAAPAKQVAEPAAEPDEVVVTLGDEASPAEEDESTVAERAAPQWVKDVRKRIREVEAENRELKKAQAKPAEPSQAAVGAKPTLEGCDFDAEKFEADLDAWKERKRAFDADQDRKKREEQDAAEAWQKKLTTYAEKKAALKVSDFAEAEAEALGKLSNEQQGVILEAVGEHAATLIYALGKSPKKLAEIAALKNPIALAVAVTELKAKMTVTPRKPPPPETRVVGAAPSDAGNGDKELDRLRAEADKTGDRSNVVAYMRQQRRAK